MSLGHVYDMDLKRNESVIKEVIIQAQGEVSHDETSLIDLADLVSTDGAGGVYTSSEGDLDRIHPRSCQLPEQVPVDQVRPQYSSPHKSPAHVSHPEDGTTCSTNVAKT